MALCQWLEVITSVHLIQNGFSFLLFCCWFMACWVPLRVILVKRTCHPSCHNQLLVLRGAAPLNFQRMCGISYSSLHMPCRQWMPQKSYGLVLDKTPCSVQLSSVTQSCPAVCDPLGCSTPGLPVHHPLLEFTQTHVRWVGNAIQPSRPLSSPSPPTFNLSQHQGLS